MTIPTQRWLSERVTSLSSEELPTELEIALAYTPQSVRDRLKAYFAFDQRLARIVSGTTEPMLGQMRLAWWRDMLEAPASDRPKGDVVLEAIGEHWGQDASLLVPTVDGWEGLVAADTLVGDHIEGIAQAKAVAIGSLAAGLDDALRQRVYIAAARYTSAEVALGLSDETERALTLAFAGSIETPKMRLPVELRGLAVLEQLSLRAIKRGGAPLMQGRGAALTALRGAIFRQ